MKKQFTQIVMPVVAMFGLSLSFPIYAENVQSKQNVSETQLASDKQAQAMTAAALQALGLIAQGKSDEVWDGLSPAIKPLISRNSFIQRIKIDQANFGEISKREPVSAYRSEANGQNNIPKGIYYSVVFMTHFSKGQGRELLSFHLDNDQIWRVAGYSLTRVESK